MCKSLVLFICLMMLSSSQLFAEQWKFEVSPYLWAVSQQGQTGYIDRNGQPVNVDIDMSFSEIFENLDGAVLVNFQAEKGNWNMWVDLVYMKLKYDAKVDNVSAELTAKQKLLDVVAAYRFARQGDMHWYSFMGVRFVDVNNQLDVRIVDQRLTPNFGDNWLDPLFGLKNKWVINESFYLNSRAELGGFGVGSDLSWALNFTLNQNLSDNWDLKYSFRYIDLDYQDNDFLFDMASSGFGVGVTYQF
ncbi:hypothetical protein [Shewanella pneumatophori]|uniref:Outer membrane protein beta-barrel domain-containing protein n=1 Tax=Shewanella pneumatophori TaxID=314092 RepID=A0A9X2CHL4_9GAMM|nr:hypothetical protein [Shewanella pneumatophori]MCL1138544.1 hypothetical protein [Shewanella pneumatophori]